MTNSKKQAKIKMSTGHPEDCNEIQKEIDLLVRKLRDKKIELFQLQRNSYRHQVSAKENEFSDIINGSETFVRPQRIILKNSVESFNKDLQLLTMLTGMEVQSYVANDHCCIIYHMQHDSQYVTKHGLRIDLKSGVPKISKSALPLGFNLTAVLEDYDNVMMPDCLGAIRKALVAYHCRLEQYEALKKLLNIEAKLFKVIDGSHIEVSFLAQSNIEEDNEPIDIVLILDYRVYDVRPKTISFKEIDLPEGAAQVLRGQCNIFKKKPLKKAFSDAFIDGVGPYKLSQHVAPALLPARRRKRARAVSHPAHDDTFRPEDCSEPSDDDFEH